MAFEFPGAGALDYVPCRYGDSRLQFRGPERPLDRPYVAVLGGTETYGKFVPAPYAALLEDYCVFPVVNLGLVNAGLDVYLNDPAVLRIAAAAEVTIVQALGAHNLTNRYYMVHPRRNDRFVRATPLLKALYKEVDFTEFNFTRHMVTTLQAISPERFEMVAQELRRVWSERMEDLAHRLGARTALLWFSRTRPPVDPRRATARADVPLVDAAMIEAARVHFSTYVEVIPSALALAEGVSGLAFATFDAAAAAEVPGPAAHREAARLLHAAVAPLM